SGKTNGKTNGKIRTPPAPTQPADCNSIYYRSALKDECAALAAMPKDSGRNDALNRAAFNLSQLVAIGGLDADTVREQLFAAAEACGLVAEDGANSVRATIDSGSRAGLGKPRQVSEWQQSAPCWPDVTKEGSPRRTYRNARAAIEALGIICRYDEFHDRML